MSRRHTARSAGGGAASSSGDRPRASEGTATTGAVPAWRAGDAGGPGDARSDAEVLREARAFDPFPTLAQALPTALWAPGCPDISASSEYVTTVP